MAKDNRSHADKVKETSNRILDILVANKTDDASQEVGKLQEAVHAMISIAEKEGPINRLDNLAIVKYQRLLDKTLEDNPQLRGDPANQLVKVFEEIAKVASSERGNFIQATTDKVLKIHNIERTKTIFDEKGRKEFALMLNTLESLVAEDAEHLIGKHNSKEYQQQIKAIKGEFEHTADLGKPERLKQKLQSLQEWCADKSQEAESATKWSGFTKAVKSAVSMVTSYCKGDIEAYNKHREEFKQITGNTKVFALNLGRIKQVLNSNNIPPSESQKPSPPIAKKNVPRVGLGR